MIYIQLPIVDAPLISMGIKIFIREYLLGRASLEGSWLEEENKWPMGETFRKRRRKSQEEDGWGVVRRDRLAICFPGGSAVKNPPANAGDMGLIPELGRPPGEGNGYPLQYSCLGNPMDREAWRAIVYGVTKEPDTTSQLNNNKQGPPRAQKPHCTPGQRKGPIWAWSPQFLDLAPNGTYSEMLSCTIPSKTAPISVSYHTTGSLLLVYWVLTDKTIQSTIQF